MSQALRSEYLKARHTLYLLGMEFTDRPGRSGNVAAHINWAVDYAIAALSALPMFSDDMSPGEIGYIYEKAAAAAQQLETALKLLEADNRE